MTSYTSFCAARARAMQARLAEVKRRYLFYPFETALALIEARVRAELGAPARP